MPLVSPAELDEFLEAHPAWSSRGNAIARTWRFADFNEATGFVVRVALLAEKANHHPDVDIRWNEVTLTLSTHSENGVTHRDLDLAAALDALP